MHLLYCCSTATLETMNWVEAHKPQVTQQFRGAGVVQWWERWPITNVSQVQFPDPASYVDWVCCWFSPLLWGFFSRFSSFPPSSKINISKFQFDREFEGHRFISWRLLCVTLVKQSWLILFYFIMQWSNEKYIWLTFLDLKQFKFLVLNYFVHWKGNKILLLTIVFFSEPIGEFWWHCNNSWQWGKCSRNCHC